MLKPLVPLLKVSERARDLVQSLEASMTMMREAQLSDEVESSYSAVSLSRECLFTYLSELERKCRIEQPVTMRF